MSYKKVIVPIGTALAALIANASEGSIIQADAQRNLSDFQEQTARESTSPTDPILQRLMYQVRQQAHTLTLHKSSSGAIYANHGSHRSHSSHRSHRSGR